MPGTPPRMTQTTQAVLRVLTAKQVAGLIDG